MRNIPLFSALLLAASMAFTNLHAEDPAGHEKMSPEQRAAKMIQKFDKNGDGKLDATELAASIEAHQEHKGGHADKKGDCKGGAKDTAAPQ